MLIKVLEVLEIWNLEQSEPDKFKQEEMNSSWIERKESTILKVVSAAFGVAWTTAVIEDGFKNAGERSQREGKHLKKMGCERR